MAKRKCKPKGSKRKVSKMARRSGSAATNSVSVGGDAPGKANPGIPVSSFTGKESR